MFLNLNFGASNVKDLALDVAEGVLGAAKDGGVKMFIVVPPPTLP